MSEFTFEDLEGVISQAENSLVQMLALQLRNQIKSNGEITTKCAALAADNSALNKFIKDDCWIWDDKSEEYFDAADCMPETPPTDAFLAEVRAQGADAVADQHRRMYEELKPINKFFANDHMNAQKVAELVAAQLRQEAAQ